MWDPVSHQETLMFFRICHLYETLRHLQCTTKIRQDSMQDQSKYGKKIMEGKRKPFGLKVSEDRIKLLYENQNVYVIIEDISDDTNTGTKVTLKFPKVM